MKKLASVTLIIFLANMALAQLTPGPPGGHPNPPPYPGNPNPPPYPGNPNPPPYPGNPNPPPYPGNPNPPYNPPPNYGSCLQDLCVGDRAYNISRDYREVEIIGIESSRTYVLRFLDTGGVGGNWTRQDLAVQRGCSSDLCVGQEVFNVQRDSRRTRIVGIQPNGLYVLRFLDTNGVGGNWSRADLAVDRGCSGDICVGEMAYNVSRDYRRVQVVGIQLSGQFVLRFFDTNGVGANWTRSDLALERGCGRSFCVGQYALNIPRNRQVQIVAIDWNRNYVLRFLDTGAVGGGWSDSDLIRQ